MADISKLGLPLVHIQRANRHLLGPRRATCRCRRSGVSLPVLVTSRHSEHARGATGIPPTPDLKARMSGNGVSPQPIDSGRSTLWSGSDGDCRQTARFDPEQASPQRPIGSFTCTRLEGLSLHANSFGICNLGKLVRPAKSSRMAYGTSSKDGTWLRNHVQALASACCEEARSCFILHHEA